MNEALQHPDEVMLGEIRHCLAALPSCVRLCGMPGPAEALSLAHFDVWAPARSRDPLTDYCRGRDHFAEALFVSYKEDSALMIHLIVMTMAARLSDSGATSFGPIEQGFVDAAAERAVAGRLSPEAPDEWAAIVADHQPADIIRARENETAMRTAIYVSKGDRKRLASLYLVHLMRLGRPPIELGVWQFASAAMNGGRN